MADVHDSVTRSRNMAAIRAKDTGIERVVRNALHRAGFRYRLHVHTLAGNPDIVMPKYKAVIFVNGCFWHGHDCRFFRLPKTRQDFWKGKISRNVFNDLKNRETLRNTGWRTADIWECALKKSAGQDRDAAIHKLQAWIISDIDSIDIRGV